MTNFFDFIKMFTKISLLKVSAGISVFEQELAAQNFVIAANNVFHKAQGLAMIAPLHETAFGLLKGLLNDWHMLGMECAPARGKAKAKAKAMEQDKEGQDKATRQQCLELENFVVLPTVTIGDITATSTEYFKIDVSLLSGAKISDGRKADLMLVAPATWALVLQRNGMGFKSKGKSKAIVMEKTSDMHTFKSKEIVKSDSDENKEKRGCVIKKVKHEHVEELIRKEKKKEVEKSQVMMCQRHL
ncbi:hypothetical protein C0995_016733 [Termitomyces sp. Mi166|nr:hypothetical protein C0995_016733 [Termitomyces sp. Mi166\